MPYTKNEDRARTGTTGPANVGDLTFLLYRIALEYVAQHGLRYATIADVRAALYGTMTEFDRRLAFKYEDKKISENGDVLTGNPEVDKWLSR